MQFCCWFPHQDYPTDEQTTVFESIRLYQEKFEIVGKDGHYSLALQTNDYICEQSISQQLPEQLLKIIADDQKFQNKPQKIFIPDSNDEQLLQYFQRNNNLQIYTHKTNQGITQLPFSKKLDFIDQNSDNILTIFNFCKGKWSRIQTELNNFGKISNNNVFIFEFQKNIDQLISQVMKYQEETFKEELQLVRTNGSNSYYLFFLGKLNSTKKISRKNIIADILTTQEQKKVILMLKYLQKKNYKYKDIIKHIAQMKQQNKEQLNQQQSVNLLELFISSICKEKKVDKQEINEIIDYSQFGDEQTTTQALHDTNNYILNFIKQRVNSYCNTSIKRTQSFLSQLN